MNELFPRSLEISLSLELVRIDPDIEFGTTLVSANHGRNLNARDPSTASKRSVYPINKIRGPLELPRNAFPRPIIGSILITEFVINRGRIHVSRDGL